MLCSRQYSCTSKQKIKQTRLSSNGSKPDPGQHVSHGSVRANIGGVSRCVSCFLVMCCRDQIYYLCWKFASFWQWYKCAIQHHWNSCYFVYASQGVILCHFKPIKPSVIIINWGGVTLWHLQNITGISLLQLLNKSLHWRKTKHLFTDRALDMAKQLMHRLRNREGEIPQDQLILL